MHSSGEKKTNIFYKHKSDEEYLRKLRSFLLFNNGCFTILNQLDYFWFPWSLLGVSYVTLKCILVRVYMFSFAE